jgi:hypothetical protein
VLQEEIGDINEKMLPSAKKGVEENKQRIKYLAAGRKIGYDTSAGLAKFIPKIRVKNTFAVVNYYTGNYGHYMAVYTDSKGKTHILNHSRGEEGHDKSLHDLLIDGEKEGRFGLEKVGGLGEVKIHNTGLQLTAFDCGFLSLISYLAICNMVESGTELTNESFKAVSISLINSIDTLHSTMTFGENLKYNCFSDKILESFAVRSGLGAKYKEEEEEKEEEEKEEKEEKKIQPLTGLNLYAYLSLKYHGGKSLQDAVSKLDEELLNKDFYNSYYKDIASHLPMSTINEILNLSLQNSEFLLDRKSVV